MRKEDVYIPGEDYAGENLVHGRTWSEEAKQRVREARRAGRSVYEMFSNFYNSQKKNLNPKAISKGINRIGKDVNRVARNTAVNINRFGKAVNKVKNKVVRGIDDAVYTKKERSRNKKEIAKLRDAVKRNKGLVDKVPPSERAAIEKQLKSDTAKLNKKLTDTHKQYKKSINSKIDDVKNKADELVYSGKERSRDKKAIKKLSDKLQQIADKYNNAPDFGPGKLSLAERKAMRKEIVRLYKERERLEGDSKKRYNRSINSKIDKALKPVNDALKPVKKTAKNIGKKVQRTIDDINTNGGKGYRDPLSKKSYAERVTNRSNGKITSDKYDSYEEGKRYDKLTDMITRKNGQTYKVHEQADLTKKKNKKKKNKVNRHVTFDSYESAARHSGLSNVYIPGKTGSSDVILHSTNYLE